MSSQPPPTPPMAGLPFSLQPDAMLPLLEVSKGQPLTDEVNPHFYLLSALLPLAQLTPASRQYMIYSSLEETEQLKLRGLDGGDNAIKIIEFECAVVGQSSRAIGGEERKALSTTRIETANQSQEQQRVGIIGAFQNLMGRK